jgi:hypothetical protein
MGKTKFETIDQHINATHQISTLMSLAHCIILSANHFHYILFNKSFPTIPTTCPNSIIQKKIFNENFAEYSTIF